MKYEFTRRWWFSGPPCNNFMMPSLEAIISEMFDQGWEMLSVLPGQDHPVAEHITPPQILFRRPLAQVPAHRAA